MNKFKEGDKIVSDDKSFIGILIDVGRWIVVSEEGETDFNESMCSDWQHYDEWKKKNPPFSWSKFLGLWIK